MVRPGAALVAMVSPVVEAGVADTLEAQLADARKRHADGEYGTIPLTIAELGIRAHGGGLSATTHVTAGGIAQAYGNFKFSPDRITVAPLQGRRDLITWRESIELQLEVTGLKGFADGTVPIPPVDDVELRGEFRATHLLTLMVNSRCCSPVVQLALRSCRERLDAGQQAWHFILSTYQAKDDLYIGQLEEKMTHIRMGEQESATDYCNRARRILAEMWMMGAEYSTASYITHVLKGMPHSYNLMKRMTMVPGTRESLDEDSVTSYILQDEAMKEAEQPTELFPQASYATPMKPDHQQEQRGKLSGGRGCHAGEPTVVLLDSGCSHHLMGTKEAFVEMKLGGDVKHVRGFNGALQNVEGHGTIALRGETGKQILVPNVLYVPGVHANLLSAGQLKDSGVKLRDVGDKMLLVSAAGDVLAVSLESKGWEVLDLTDNKVVTTVETIFYETMSVEAWKVEHGPISTRKPAVAPTDPSSTMTPLLAVKDDNVEDVTPPSAPTFTSPLPLVADLPKTASPSTTGDEGSIAASPLVPARGIAGSRQEPTAEDQLDDDASRDIVEVLGGEEGELFPGEQSDDCDMVEFPVEELKPSRSTRPNIGKPTEKLSYHACLPSTSYSTLLDDADADVNLPDLDPDMHADPEHCWDIATMTVKEALASWKGKAVNAAMDEEINSLIANGTWELVEQSEYVVATEAGKEARRVRFLLAEFRLLDTGKSTVLHVDNQSAITAAEGSGLKGNLKHMERRYEWLQHMVKRGKIALQYILTTEKPADFLMKALHFPAFNQCSVVIGQVRLADIGDGDDEVLKH
ncbi:unnamed protein product [Closterium sp. NIES-54]